MSQTPSETISLGSYPSGQKYIDSVETILDYLNQGGKLGELQKTFTNFNIPFAVKDITNDGDQDLLIVYGSGGIRQFVILFWCEAGHYDFFPKDLAETETLISEAIRTYSINDLNKNGVPEVLSVGDGRAGLNINLLEWNGESFIDLTSSETKFNAYMAGASSDDFELMDINFDGIPELVLTGTPNSWYYPGEPLRTQTDTYQWSGKTYSPSTSFNSLQFRFQAIQDGDNLTNQGIYKEATRLYQDAIDSKVLDWWSKERFESDRDAAIHSTTPPALNPDPAEYPRLAAYAYYRIMLLHLVQGNESGATTTYNTLQQTFGNDPYGQTHVEMAAAFWEAYQSTHKMYDSCAAAIQYAVEHPEILIPLGSDYHGSQSHTYVPADVCPFR
jgi:hypothetical protein